MLLAKQIARLAAELRNEAAGRKYVRALIPQVVEDEIFWSLILEMIEIVIHRHGYVIVERHRVRENEPAAAVES